MNWRYRDTVLLSCTCALFATMVARLVLSPVVPAITAEFDISNTVIGIALTGMWMAYGLVQYPSGVLAGRVGERKIILVAVGGTAVMSFAVAIAPLFGLFVLCTILLGAVAGLHYSVGTTLLSRTYEDVGTAIGLHNIGGTTGGLLAPIAAAWVGVRYGWRPAVAIGTGVAVPVLLLFAWQVRPTEPLSPTRSIREQFELQPVRDFLRRPPIAFTVFIAVIVTFVWQGTASFLPTFLVKHKNQSATMAGTIFSVYFVVQGVVQVGVGTISDRYGRDLVITGCLATGIIGFVLFIAISDLVAIVTGVILAGIGMSSFTAIMARFMDEFAEAERGTGFGLTQTVNMVLSSFGSVAVGVFADVLGWAASFGILVFLLICAFCALIANRLFSLGY
ncbi:MFS transporter [Halalkalicoccus sp. NIPERK01]|uniref:MFS transporter n=1 Tax=Halalkalicoccus sp. NIPERK01 TaxID=3053469 RepID=UPI00256F0AFD|nr:MFS transporter [Halalkalicoccus sp. NIPERK01]MDL5363104.1 MFS transporter [Halalkalicoccus sp. NIPERK01]